MPRFFSPLPLAVGLQVELPESVSHHIYVLRLQPGAQLCLFNGHGGQYLAELERVEKRRASVRVSAFEPVECELAYPVTLAQALPEASKMDWIIEKAVEMGVAAITPLAAQRSVVRLSGERAEKRQAHWQGVIIAATEQCGRNRLASLAPVQTIARWTDARADQPRILLSPRAGESLAQWARARPAQAVTIMIGPEGGFTAQEEDAAIASGAIALSMGARVLRTETAGIAALATLNAAWDMTAMPPA